MENYLVVLILSVFVLLGALYVHTVDQNIVQITDELLQHGNEIKKVKLELEWTRNELKQGQVEYKSTSKKITEMKVELESIKKEVKQVKVELESTRNALNKVKVDFDSTREQINILRADMIEKDNAYRKEINKIRVDVNALSGELNKIKTGHQGETYIRWGKSSCPQKATLVYDGYAAGNDYSIGGSGSNFLCLPKNPDWKEYTSGANPHTGRIFGVEYEILNHKPYPKSFHNQDMPCAVCLTARSTVLMVPGKLKCHKGWTKEFSGYLMSEMSTSTRTPSEYICVDEKLESVPGGGAGRDQSVVYPVEAVCGNLKCPPYVGGRELTCVVCSK